MKKNSINETNIVSEKNFKCNNELASKENVLQHDTNINNYAYIKEKCYKNDSNILGDNNEDSLQNLRNNKFSFIEFLFNKLSCNKKNKYFEVYENFRTKIMSEEHLLKNHFEVYGLLKICELKGYELENRYILKDLMNKG